MVIEEKTYFIVCSIILAPLVHASTVTAAAIFFLPVTALTALFALMALGGAYALRLHKIFQTFSSGALDNANLERADWFDPGHGEPEKFHRTKGLPKLFYFHDLAVDLSTGRVVWASASLKARGFEEGSLLYIHKSDPFAPFMIPDIVCDRYLDSRKTLRAELVLREGRSDEARVTKQLKICEAYRFANRRKQHRRLRPLERGRLAVRRLKDVTPRNT